MYICFRLESVHSNMGEFCDDSNVASDGQSPTGQFDRRASGHGLTKIADCQRSSKRDLLFIVVGMPACVVVHDGYMHDNEEEEDE